MKKIHKISINTFNDDISGTENLGAYSNTPGKNSTPGKNCIDREARGDKRNNEYRYFNVALSAEETGNPNSVEQDYQRAEAFNRGDWCYMAMRAMAEISVGGVLQNIRSGGLWGMESDADKEYFQKAGAEQLAELKDILVELGFSAEEIEAAPVENK